MKSSTATAKLQHEPRNSQNQRDASIEKLWRTLDPQQEGELDLTGLQHGLRRVDHRELFTLNNAARRGVRGPTRSLTHSSAMKNADAMLRKILEAVDTNGDGRIQYDGT
jgi:solute carrier family 25 phosphate transporter 23/24/25/41